MKQELIQHLISEQEEIISQMQAAEDRADDNADVINDTSVDMEDKSQQDQSTDMANFYDDQQEDNADAIATLKQNLNYSTDKFELGALVETKETYYFVGASIPKTEYNGKTVLGISENSPVYDENTNHKAKDGLVIAGKNIPIVKIY